VSFSRWLSTGGVLLALVVAGAIGSWFVSPAWTRIRQHDPALNLAALEDALGQGVTVALLGGFRSLVADFLWLANNAAWEARNLPKSQSLIRLTTAVDPRPLYFWINGARMIAYDMPVWRIDEQSNRKVLTEKARRQVDCEQAEVALELLEAALRHHPSNPLVSIEIANIHLRRLGDVETAARFYRAAASQPGAPGFAARIHAELLKKLGRRKEALEWLVAHHRKLDPQDPAALAAVVLQRIRELEESLAIPRPERYQPGP